MCEQACIHCRFIHAHTYRPAQMRAQASHSSVCLYMCSHTHVYNSHTRAHGADTHALSCNTRTKHVQGQWPEHACAQLCRHRNTPTHARPRTARCSRMRISQLSPHPASLASARHLLSAVGSNAPSLGTLELPGAPHGGAVPPTSHAGWDLHTGPSFSLWPLPPADQPVLLEEAARHQNLQVLRHASRAPRKASWRR